MESVIGRTLVRFEQTFYRYATAVSVATVAVLLVVALLLAAAIPYHESDALSYGEWSRLIAEHWHLRFSGISDQTYHRPFFYVLQGVLWGILGFSERTGRIFSGAFSVLFVVSVAWIALRGPQRWLRASFAALLVVVAPVFARPVVAGLTDIPVAAFVALTGALVWRRPATIAAAVGIAAAAAGGVLAKPSALLALLSLALAQLIGARTTLVQRLRFRVVPIAAGCLLALVYDLIQTRYVHEGLFRFLKAGTTDPYYRSLAATFRRGALLDFGWLGDDLRVLLLFALIYAAARAAGAAHKPTAIAAAPAALVLAWLAPYVAAKEVNLRAGLLSSTWWLVSGIVLAGVCAAAALAPEDAIPTRVELGRLLVWAIPPYASWVVYAAYDGRLLAPAWPALFALVAITSFPAVLALARTNVIAAVVPFVILVVFATQNVDNLDGLGSAGWKQLRAHSFSSWFDDRVTRPIVLPGFADTLQVVSKEMGRRDRLFTSDGRFRFYFPGRVLQSYPAKCSDLRGYRVFVLATDSSSMTYMQQTYHVSPQPAFWAACTDPKLTQLTDGSNGSAVFRVAS